jgi:CBS domain-containing protein
MPRKRARPGAGPRLHELMTTEVVTLSPEDTLREAVGVLAGRRISGVPVLEGQTVVGVVSATDILEFASSTPAVPGTQPEAMNWGEWESAPEEGEGEEPASSHFVELWDDAGAATDERFRETRGPEWDLLAEHTVSEIMSRRIHALPPDALVTEAAAEMLRTGTHRILVMQEDRLLGVVSTTDIMRAMVRPGDT